MASYLVKEVRDELNKIKALRKRTSEKLTAESLKLIKGFENMSNESRQQVLETLEEYARIVILQLNRILKTKQTQYGKLNEKGM